MVRHRSAKPLSPVQIRLPPFHNNKMEHCILHNHAGVAELADALDSKSSAREGVPVRPRPPVSQKKQAQRDGFHLSRLVFLGSLSNGADVWQVCFAPRDICTPVKLGFAEVQMSLTPLNSGERPLTGTERLDCFRTSGESLLIGGTELSSLSYLDSSADSHRFYLYPVIFLGT